MGEAHHHRPTLKQSNKAFKSKHATKSSLKDAAKGRVPRQSPKSTSITNNASANLRHNRRNNAKQAQLKKREALVSATRIFNGPDGAPRIVAVIPLSEDISSAHTVASLAQAVDVPIQGLSEKGMWKMRADRFKTSLQFITTPYGDFYGCLDACKIADYALFVLSPSVQVTTWGDTLLRTLQAQGLPDVVTVVSSHTNTSIHIDAKSRPGILKSLLSFTQYFVPSQSRVYDLHSSSDTLNALRALSEGKPEDVRWREDRSYLLGEAVDWVEDGTLKVTGVVRGSSLSADRLVHIPNFGDYQIAKILSAPLPRHSRSKSIHANPNGVDMEIEPTLLAEPNESSADSLISTNDPDDMGNEQTWPTEEEMMVGADPKVEASLSETASIPDARQGTTPKSVSVRRIPKGMSEYQAAWIVDDDDDDDGDGGDSDGDKEDEDGGEDNVMGAGDGDGEEDEEEMVDLLMDEDQEMETDGRKTVTFDFEDLDHEEEHKQLQSWRNRKREEEDDFSFPDEIDTPQDVPARTRFQRFRGLRSFRTSPWDAYENLPRDYARIFQFEDYKRTERSVKRRAEEGVGLVEPGVRVTVLLKDVPQDVTSQAPLMLFTLLQHEHKVSVLNFTVQRNTEYDGSVRSKDPLILCVGPRRLQVNPVYSQLTRGGGKGANNVHKFERYLRHGQTSVATIYGPVVFGKQPCVLLREAQNENAPQLVAMGTFSNPDTTRVIAKRIILTGHPFKVHKKTATVRYMFFNSDDVHYFKPIQLHTKHGRTGHIRESLGTHGYLKAHFDGPINQMDTVCMSLYKRVFPKWASLWKQSAGTAHGHGEQKLPSDAMEE